MAGYSSRSLADKLGIKPGLHVLFLDPPPGYREALGTLPDGVVVSGGLQPDLDFIHVFTKSRGWLGAEMPRLRQALAQNGALWVSWPKGASKVPTDLTENIVREIALANNLVDVKVAAIDEVWSGLKLVIRKEHRKPQEAMHV